MDSFGKTEFERMTEWKEGYTTTIIIFVVITVIQLAILFGAFQFQAFKDIKKNFKKYRCNPIFMPFVGNFGYNPIQNFNYCVESIFHIKAAEVFAPIYNILGTFQKVIKTVVDAAMSIRGIFEKFLGGVQNFIAGVRNKIQFLMNNVRMSFIRILNLMGKVYGSMFAVLFMGQSAMTAAFNLADNDLVKFLFEFCFAPATPVKMFDGTYKPIKDVVIGDRLAGVSNKTDVVVTSVFRFAGGSTPMVAVGDVVMSAQHYVAAAGMMIPASAHPSAVGVSSIPELVCLNVTGHRFLVGYDGLVVADYDEHSDGAVVTAAQRMALGALNGGVFADETDKPIVDYSLGVGGETEVCMADGSWKRVDKVAIGDVVKYSGPVLGLVAETCASVVKSPTGITFSGAQLVYDPTDNRWIRSANRWTGTDDGVPSILYSIFTKNSGVLLVRCAGGSGSEEYTRDYREVPLPDMEDAYTAAFVKN